MKDIKIDSSEVDDELFQEYWDRTGGVPDDLRDAVKELRDATEDVRDGLDELSDNNDDINDATAELFDAYLEETTNALKGYGMNIELTESNYESKLDDLIEASPSQVMKTTLILNADTKFIPLRLIFLIPFCFDSFLIRERAVLFSLLLITRTFTITATIGGTATE